MRTTPWTGVVVEEVYDRSTIENLRRQEGTYELRFTPEQVVVVPWGPLLILLSTY